MSRRRLGPVESLVRPRNGSAWTAFTPTLSGGWLLGNSTYTATYMKIGRLVVFNATIVVGSTATKGTTLTAALPVTAADAEACVAGLSCSFPLVAGAANGPGIVKANSTTVVDLQVVRADLTYASRTGVTASAPATWATSDRIVYGGLYEAAA